jgi:soluble lytic murein transglycosylase-like protein
MTMRNLLIIVIIFGVGIIYGSLVLTVGDNTNAAVAKNTTPAIPPDAFIVAYIQHKNNKVYPSLAEDIARAVVSSAGKYKLPKEVLLALIEVESTFNYCAESSAGAIGLMQIYPKIWLKEGAKENLITQNVISNKKDLYDPTKNIAAGAFILSHYYKQTKSLKGALTKYFGGTQNSHYQKVCQRVGEFFVYSKLTI